MNATGQDIRTSGFADIGLLDELIQQANPPIYQTSQSEQA